MPLVLRIERGGKTVKTGWDYFALSCIYTAAMKEASPETRINDEFTYGTVPDGSWVDWSLYPIYYMDGCPLLEAGYQVLGQDHVFETTYENGEHRVFELKRGDKLVAYRESKH